MKNLTQFGVLSLISLSLIACKTIDATTEPTTTAVNPSPTHSNPSKAPPSTTSTINNPALNKRPADPFTPPVVPPSPYNLEQTVLNQHDWQLVRIDDRAGKNIFPAQLKQLKPLVLHFSNERLLVLNSCNTMNIDYRLQQGRLITNNILMTRKACDTPLMTLENIATKALKGDYLFVLDSQSKTQLLVQQQDYSLLFNPIGKKSSGGAKHQSDNKQSTTAAATKISNPKPNTEKVLKEHTSVSTTKTLSVPTAATKPLSTQKVEPVKTATKIDTKPKTIEPKASVESSITRTPVATPTPTDEGKKESTLNTIKQKFETFKDKVTGKTNEIAESNKTEAKTSIEKVTKKVTTTTMPSSAYPVVDAPSRLPDLDKLVKPIQMKTE